MKNNIEGEEEKSSKFLKSGPPDLSLVLPCFNEEDVIRNTVLRLLECFQEKDISLELILVDNGSSDSTGNIIDEMIQEGNPIVKKTIKKNEGYGNGVLKGLEVCCGKFVGFTCSDGQVEATDVVKLYEIASQAKTPKLAKVRRRFRMDGMTRKIVSICYNLIITVMFGGLGSIDVNGNPKIFPKDYLGPMSLKSKDWFLDAEVMIKAKKVGLGVFEMNVMAQMREGGSSNVRPGTVCEFIMNLVKYRFGRERGFGVKKPKVL